MSLDDLKDNYGANSTENFVDDLIVSHGLKVPPFVRQLIIDKVKADEAKLLEPIIKDIKDNNLKDDPDFFKKIEKRRKEYATIDCEKKSFKLLTQEDKDMLKSYDNDISGKKVVV